MKGLLIGGSIVLSLLLGIWPNGTRLAKPAWWRWMTIVSLLALVLLALSIKTGGSFAAAATVAIARPTAVLPVRGTVTDASLIQQGHVGITDRMGREQDVALDSGKLATSELRQGRDVILDVSFDHSAKQFTAHRLASTDPWVTLPLIPSLEERARNLYFHVPVAWLAQLGWFVAFAYAVIYLRKRRPEDDIRASSAAALGALFCLLATVTGAIWARFNWGVFWNWDPRQISIFIVLIIYGAYFALRSAIEDEEQRSRISAVYLILLAVPVVFFLFVLPRLVDSLHPGSANDVNAGPLISPQEDALDPVKQVIYAVAFFSYALLFFWMLNVSVRARVVELFMRRKAVARLEAEERAASVPM